MFEAHRFALMFIIDSNNPIIMLLINVTINISTEVRPSFDAFLEVLL
jgi:hypothetical protein